MLLANDRARSLYLANLEVVRELNALGLQALNQSLCAQFEAASRMLAAGRREVPEMLWSQDAAVAMRAWQLCATEAMDVSAKLSRDMLSIAAEMQGRFGAFIQQEVPELTSELLAQAEDVAKNLTRLPTSVTDVKEAKKAA